MSFKRLDSDFSSKGTRCAGWLYLPDGAHNPPVVVMAHGFAAERSFRLPAFAERFAEAGMAVYLFDYRNFGDSEGEPRNLVNPWRHLEDWRAAIEHVRGMRDINPGRMALWGTSFSGGHVIMAAADDPDIKAIVAQVPHMGFTGTSQARELKVDRSFLRKMLVAGIKDLIRSRLAMSPHYIKVVGEPDELAMLNRPGCLEGYLAIVPEDSKWKNECPARIVFSIARYRPIARAHKIKCPALIVMAENDQLIPSSLVEKGASRMPDATLVRLPVDHFATYIGETFEEAVKIEAEFLKKNLLIPLSASLRKLY
jgi:dienelactone hydrolase